MSTQKYVVLGDAACGKSAFCNALGNGSFQETHIPTIIVDFKGFNVHEKSIMLWDTAGQKEYKEITSFYKGRAHAYIVMFDLTRLASFEHAKQEISSLQQEYEGIPIILVGAKSDLTTEIAVTPDMISQFNAENQYPYFETSAKNKINVDAVLDKAIELTPEYPELIELPERRLEVEDASENKKSWNPFSDTYYYARNFLKHARVIQTPLYQKFRDAFYVFFGRDNWGNELRWLNFRRHAGLLDYLIIFPLINRIYTGLIDKAKTIESKGLKFFAKLAIRILVGIPYVALNLVKAAVSLALVIATAPVTLAVGFITFCMRKYHEKKAKSIQVETESLSEKDPSTTQSLLAFMKNAKVKNYHEMDYEHEDGNIKISAYSYNAKFSIEGNQSALRSFSILAVDNVTMNNEEFKEELSLKK